MLNTTNDRKSKEFFFTKNNDGLCCYYIYLYIILGLRLYFINSQILLMSWWDKEWTCYFYSELRIEFTAS